MIPWRCSGLHNNECSGANSLWRLSRSERGCFSRTHETLRPEKQVPFMPSSVLHSAKPLANLGILLTNGSELLRLALAAVFHHSCTST